MIEEIEKLKQEASKTFEAWSKVKFIDGPERAEYNKAVGKYMNSLSEVREHKVAIPADSCNLDDEECLSCGS
jgi:hypothetical protein